MVKNGTPNPPNGKKRQAVFPAHQSTDTQFPVDYHILVILAFQFSNNLSLIYSLPTSLSNEFYRNRDIPKVR